MFRRSSSVGIMVSPPDDETSVDKIHRLRDENLELKKNSHDKDNRLKLLTTKLNRMMNQERQFQLRRTASDIAIRQSVDVEEAIDDLRSKVSNLENQNSLLRNRLQMTRQLVATATRRIDPFSFVRPKINTGLSIRGVSRSAQPSIGRSPVIPSHAAQLLDDASNEIKRLTQELSTAREELLKSRKEEQQQKELRDDVTSDADFRLRAEVAESQLTLLSEQLAAERASHLRENVELLRLRKEIVTLREKCADLDENLRRKDTELVRAEYSCQSTRDQIEGLRSQVRERDERILEMRETLGRNEMLAKTTEQLQQEIGDLKAENEVLKSTNAHLVESVNRNDERDYRIRQLQTALRSAERRVAALQSQLDADHARRFEPTSAFNDQQQQQRSISPSVLEEVASLKAELFLRRERIVELEKERDDLKNEIIEERRRYRELDLEHHELQLLVGQLQAKFEGLEQRVIMTVATNTSMEERVPVVVLESNGAIIEEEDYRNNLPDVQVTSVGLQTDFVASVKSEAEQNNENESNKLEELQRMLETKVGELQDARDRIRTLETLSPQQVVPASGTDQVLMSSVIPGDGSDLDDFTVEEGNSYFEFHIQRVLVRRELDIINKHTPLFVSWKFLDFDTQSTPVARGFKPVFNCTARYVLKPEMQNRISDRDNNIIRVELKSAHGLTVSLIANCVISPQMALKEPRVKKFARERLLIEDGRNKRVFLGALEYWTRYIPSADNHLVRETNSKSVASTSSSGTPTTQTPTHTPPVATLCIEVRRCAELPLRATEGATYIIYQLYNTPQECTDTQYSTRDPCFNHKSRHSLILDRKTREHIAHEALDVYVFDESESDPNVYVGKASVPLQELLHSDAVEGDFPLLDVNGLSAGSVDVRMYWEVNPLKRNEIIKNSESLHSNANTAAPPRAAPRQKVKPTSNNLPAEIRRPPLMRTDTFEVITKDQSPSDELNGNTVHATRNINSAKNAGHVTHFTDDLLVTSSPRVRLRDDLLQVDNPERLDQSGDLDRSSKSEARSKLNVDKGASKLKDRRRSEPGDLARSRGEVVGGSTKVPVSPPQPIEANVTVIRRPMTAKILQKSGSVQRRRSFKEEQQREPMIKKENAAADTTPGFAASSSLTSVSSADDDDDAGDSLATLAPAVTSPSGGGVEGAALSGSGAGGGVLSGDDDRQSSRGSALSSDSKDVVVRPAPFARPLLNDGSQRLVVTIHQLTLNEEVTVENKVFVEFSFPDCPLDELETPFSLPKAIPPHFAVYNFRRVIDLSVDKRMTHLRNMLLTKTPIVFTIVHEPISEDADCYEIGFARLFLHHIFDTQKNASEKILNVRDLKSKQVVGKLMVSVEVLAALQHIAGNSSTT